MPSDELKAELVRVIVAFKEVLILKPRAGDSVLHSIGDTFLICTVIIFSKPLDMKSGEMYSPIIMDGKMLRYRI